MTLTPISEPYAILRLTYLVITGLSLSRIMRSVGFLSMLATTWAWRSLMKSANSLPFRIFIFRQAPALIDNRIFL